MPDEERPLELGVNLVIRSHLARVVDYSDLCHKGVVIVRSADGEVQRSAPGSTWRGTYQMEPHGVAVVGVHLPSHFHLVGGSEYTVHWELAKLRLNEWRFTVPQEGYPTGEPLELVSSR